MTNDNLDQFDTLLLQFESAWREGQPPPIESFVNGKTSSSRPLLLELVKIDLEHRLRRSMPIVVEQYLEQFNSLDHESIRWNLIEYEFRLREKFSQLPTDSEIRRRFGENHEQALSLLGQSSTNGRVLCGPMTTWEWHFSR